MLTLISPIVHPVSLPQFLHHHHCCRPFSAFGKRKRFESNSRSSLQKFSTYISENCLFCNISRVPYEFFYILDAILLYMRNASDRRWNNLWILSKKRNFFLDSKYTWFQLDLISEIIWLWSFVLKKIRYEYVDSGTYEFWMRSSRWIINKYKKRIFVDKFLLFKT